jgi:putative phosphotransacetylase
MPAPWAWPPRFALSGDIKGSAPIDISNPLNGKVLHLSEGAIVAKRHIHMTPEDAKAFGVKDGEAVKVLIKQADREVIFGDTIIRVSKNFKLAMHIDTDESNAANAGGLVFGSIVDCDCDSDDCGCEGGCCCGK